MKRRLITTVVLLALAVLTGKSEVLKEIVEKDNGFSRLAKNITEQYYEKD